MMKNEIGVFPKKSALTIPVLTFAFASTLLCANNDANGNAFQNGTILQAYDWDSPADGQHWNRLNNAAADWVSKGVTAFWLPPAYKGGAGGYDVGYGAYDLWDLGEFDQKGSVRTKYGTKDEYRALIDAIHAADAQVYADIVLNHKANGDDTEWHKAVRVDPNNRNWETSGEFDIQTWTNFRFDGRRDDFGNLYYDDFEWHWYHFDGADYGQNISGQCDGCQIYKFKGDGKNWDGGVSGEKGNYDYLQSSDVDFGHPDVVAQLKKWGAWYALVANLDGFRLDATKHISREFYNEWLFHVRASRNNFDMFAVSEYWSYELGELDQYVRDTNWGDNHLTSMDVPLHGNFRDASNSGGAYDMGSIYNNTLVNIHPTLTATFVDNHDSLDGRPLASQVRDWFKPLAYAMILLRKDGYPIVFLGDHEGVANHNVASHAYLIDKFMLARKHHAYGQENVYFDHSDVVGFTREGNADHWYGVAVLMSDGPGGRKWMKVGSAHANQCFEDITGHVSRTICANGDGWAEFETNGGSVSVWVREGKYGIDQN